MKAFVITAVLGVIGPAVAGFGQGGEPGKAMDSGLTNEEILGVIRANLNQIRDCYESLLDRKPLAKGTHAVRFVIAAKTGRVTTAETEKTTLPEDKEFPRCMSRTVSAWKFPRPRGDEDVTVTYPFNFDPL